MSFVCGVTGGYVYRESAIPVEHGNYFFSDFCYPAVWSFKVNGGIVTDFADRTSELDPGSGLEVDDIVSFGENNQGELYIVDQGYSSFSGEVFKIVPGEEIFFGGFETGDTSAWSATVP